MKAYHLSWPENRESILKYGLIANNDKGYWGRKFKYNPAIFFSSSLKHLGWDFLDYENIDVWEFDVDKNNIEPDWDCSYKYWFSTQISVPPEKVKLLVKNTNPPEIKKWFTSRRKKRGLKRFKKRQEKR